MKKRILDCFKGFLIGLDSTIPGFSIGTLAILLNIYERLINDFSEILSHPWKIIKKDIWLGIGFVIGLICNIIIITYLLTHFPLQTVMFFVGLVFVSIPSTFKNAKADGIKLKEIITFVVCLAVLIGITLLNAGASRAISLNIGFIIMIFLMGVIGAGTMIIPGVSGSLIIMACGYYEAIMGILNGIISFNFSEYGTLLILLLVFIIGVVLGIVFVSKLIRILLNKFPTAVYSGILGLLVGSPFAIIYLTTSNYIIDWNNPLLYIVSAISLALGIVFGIAMLKVEKKDKDILKEVESENE